MVESGKTKPPTDPATAEPAAEVAPSSALVAALRGKRVLITGVTGFLGTALLARLLTDFPETRIVLLVRGRFGQGPQARVEELVAGNVFTRFREAVGSDAVKDVLAERVTGARGRRDRDRLRASGRPRRRLPLRGDRVVRPPDRPGVPDERGRARPPLPGGGRGRGPPPPRPRLDRLRRRVQEGGRPGGPARAPVDWRTETEAALAARDAVEDGLAPARDARPLHRQGREGARPGRPDARWPRTPRSDAATGWTKRLVELRPGPGPVARVAGRLHVHQGLGERAVEELAAERDLPLSIVRPSIIESALERPYPGWIEGFKMAEPIILAYGRGAIPEFPGIPEGIVDIIPVDLVINALLAVSVTVPTERARLLPRVLGRPEPAHLPPAVRAGPRVLPGPPDAGAGPGGRPGAGVDIPGAAAGGAPCSGPASGPSTSPTAWSPGSPARAGPVTWSAASTGTGGGCSSCAGTPICTAPTWRPRSSTPTSGPSPSTGRSPPEDRERFGFDSAAFDWSYYLQDVHCPAVTMVMRVVTPDRPPPQVRVRPSENGVLAAFDMDGTLVDSNVIESYLWLRMAELPREEWPGELRSVAARAAPRISAPSGGIAASSSARSTALRGCLGGRGSTAWWTNRSAS